MSSNPYINGTKQLICIGDTSPVSRLYSHQKLCGVMGDWYKGAMGVDRIKLTNECFKFYYDAKNGIRSQGRCLPAKLEELEDSLTDGCGAGISDLKELFHHIYINNNMWIDNTSLKYYTGRPFLARAQIDLPVPICNFAISICEKVKTLQKNIEKMQRTRLQVDSDRRRGILKYIGEVNSIVQKTDPFVWMKNSPLKRVGGKAFRYTDITMKLDSFVKNYAKIRGEMNESHSSALVFAATAEVLDFIPVLGEFYKRAFEMIPGAAGWLKGVYEIRAQKWRDQMDGEHKYLIQ